MRSAGCDSVRKVWLVQVRGCAGWWRRKGVVFGRDAGAGGGEVGEKAVGLQAGRIVGRGAGAGGALALKGSALPDSEGGVTFFRVTLRNQSREAQINRSGLIGPRKFRKAVPLSRIIVTSGASLEK